jgi:acyl-CoA thioesterase FadM
VYPYLRWIGVLLGNLVRPQRMGLFDTSILRFHVWPGDLDFFGHMNNGRFLTLMDSGRFDIMAKIGFLPILRRNRWISVLGGADIRFLRPLRPFQRFELRSRILGWDEKWFYILQEFHCDGRLAAEALVRGLMRAKGRSVPTSEALAQVGHKEPSPAMPAWVRAWAEHQDRSVGSQPV